MKKRFKKLDRKQKSRLDDALVKWEERTRSLIKATKRSQQLTAEDYTFPFSKGLRWVDK